jgi:RNA polymerase sigma factor (sigma-70 family)
MAAVPLASVVHNLRSLAIEDLSDKQLLQRFAGCGDPAAFAALVQRHGKLVLGVGHRLLGPGPDLDDIFQATFVVLARKPSAIRKQTSVAGWLFSVTYRLALQEGATGSAGIEPFATPAAMRVDLASQPDRRGLGNMVDEELQALPVAWRDALILYHLEGLSTEEAALRLEWSPCTLKERLHRARDLLRRNLRGRGITVSAMGVVIALAEQAGPTVPTLLLRSTLDAALGGAVSARVATLAVEAVQTPAAGKLKLA